MGKQRPGVLLYFSIRPCLKRLSLEEKGSLFEGILDYAQHGVWPDFDGVLGVAWDFVAPLIDADGEAYKSKCEQAKRAVETRWARTKGDTDVYGGMRANTEDTNINSNTIPNPVSVSKAITMGESEGEAQILISPVAKEMPSSPRPMSETDFEQWRKEKLERFRSWTG